jgi:signal recognition particle subunit SRP19
MSHARIEEVSDSDPSEGDISDVDEDFDEREILKARPSQVPPPQRTPQSAASLIDPSKIPSSFQPPPGASGPSFQQAEDDSKYKDFQCIYPVYFDKNRSRKEGRRVGIEQAVENPMAREIVNACGRLRLETLFEPAKMHPKDWANPGRVKIRLKGGNNSTIKNSISPLHLKFNWRCANVVFLTEHHLYTLISKHLQLNPTTEESCLQVQVPGAPRPDASKPYPKPAIPKGWKMGSILPYYSHGLTGGGVSDNFFKDMMAEMQNAGGAGGGMPDMSALAGMMGGVGGAGPSGGGAIAGGSGGGGKKEKKKKIKG